MKTRENVFDKTRDNCFQEIRTKNFNRKPWENNFGQISGIMNFFENFQQVVRILSIFICNKIFIKGIDRAVR